MSLNYIVVFVFVLFLGETAGASLDYVYGVINVPYTFGIELRDTGFHGTLLPPDQILPNAEESWAAVKEVVHYLIDKFQGFNIPKDDRASNLQENHTKKENSEEAQLENEAMKHLVY